MIVQLTLFLFGLINYLLAVDITLILFFANLLMYMCSYIYFLRHTYPDIHERRRHQIS